MPVLLERVASDCAALPWLGQAAGVLAGADHAVDRNTLEIGIVNNMPDSALLATERQFIGLLARSAA